MTKLTYHDLIDLMCYADLRKEFSQKIYDAIEGSDYWINEIARADYLSKKLQKMAIEALNERQS